MHWVDLGGSWVAAEGKWQCEAFRCPVVPVSLLLPQVPARVSPPHPLALRTSPQGPGGWKDRAQEVGADIG